MWYKINNDAYEVDDVANNGEAFYAKRAVDIAYSLYDEKVSNGDVTAAILALAEDLNLTQDDLLTLLREALRTHTRAFANGYASARVDHALGRPLS